jgi:hypothetical protein
MATATDFKPRRFKQHHEENLQVRACNYIRKNYPQVIFVSDYAAGLDLTDRQRILMMSMRSDDGQPDISIDFPSRGYHGLRVELKKEGVAIYKKDGKTLRKDPYTRRYVRNGKQFIKRGDHLAEQAAMLQKYCKQGYLGRFCVGFDKFCQLLDWYMEKPENQSLF